MTNSRIKIYASKLSSFALACSTLVLINGCGSAPDSAPTPDALFRSWTKLVNTATDGAPSGPGFNGVAVDSQNYVYACGSMFPNQALVIPGVGTVPATSYRSVLLVKYDYTGKPLWSTTLVGNDNDTSGLRVKVDRSGNMYVSGKTKASILGGQTNAAGANKTALFISKYSPSGGLPVWTKLISQAGVNTVADSLTTDSNNNIYVLGDADKSVNTGTGSHVTFIAKYDSNGNQQWGAVTPYPIIEYTSTLSTTGIAGPDPSAGFSIVADSNDNIVIAAAGGTFNGAAPTGVSDLWLTKLTPSGAVVWGPSHYGSSGTTFDVYGLENLALDKQNNIYVNGGINGDFPGVSGLTTTNQRLIVAKFDSNGTQLTSQTKVQGYGPDSTTAGNYSVYSNGIRVDSNGNIYVGAQIDGAGVINGSTAAGTNADGSMVILKYNASFTPQFTKVLGVAGQAAGLTNIDIDKNGNIFGAATIYGVGPGNFDGQAYASAGSTANAAVLTFYSNGNHCSDNSCN